jgi:hypothetical protein
MDELEISGKRYLSAKRAAREHRYHSDYIGQLIRSKKIVGEKVGRSWYVDAESLEAYLKGESVPSVPDVIVSAVVEASSEPPMPVEKTVELEHKPLPESTPLQEQATEPAPLVETHAIKINRSVEEPVSSAGLTFVSDDEPFLPEIPYTTRENIRDLGNSQLGNERVPTGYHPLQRHRIVALYLGLLLITAAAGTSLLISTVKVVGEEMTTGVSFSLPR